ncbi:MAG TPA: hypothetical protein VLH79_16545 [Chthonomonadales bacterium]|nr:hypothetical protein [Chthonomonadales bacterium]
MVVSCWNLVFPAVGGKRVVARFDGRGLTSDAGLVALGQADRRMGPDGGDVRGRAWWRSRQRTRGLTIGVSSSR